MLQKIDPGWDVLLIGGASGTGKSSVSYRLAQHFGVGITQVDDLHLVLATMTTPEQQPTLHYWATKPDSVDMSAQEILELHIAVCRVLAPALQAVITDHVEERTPIVLEGDYLLPELLTQKQQANPEQAQRVRGLFLYEPEEAQIVRNFLQREPDEGEQTGRAHVSWRFGEWLQEECIRNQITCLPTQPWATLLERTLKGIASTPGNISFMTKPVITNAEQVTPEWLTRVLSANNALTHGRVTAVELSGDRGNWSENAKLLVTYSEDAAGVLPTRLFLKMVNTDQDDESFGDSEVTYYTHDYVDVENSPLLRCYDAAYSAEQRCYHLLLDDVSESHVPANEKRPSLAYGLALAEGLATLHARWWGADGLAEAGVSMHSREHIQRFVNMAAPGVENIITHFEADLKPHWPQVMRDLVSRHPQRLIERTSDARGFTLIHGDVGEQNVLVPRQGERPIYIIDRQPFNWSLTIWLGVYDIAYAVVLDWETATRRLCEVAILKRYHEMLTERGVRDYGWEQLTEDYRLAVGMMVYVAAEYCRGGVNKHWIHVWMPMLQRALAAWDDWDVFA